MTTWVVTADSSRARLFTCDGSKSELEEFETLTNPVARLPEQGIVSDRGGATFNGGSSGSHGVDGENGAKRHEIDRFAKTIGDRLYRAKTEKKYHKLYVVAAPSLLGLLRNHLHSEVSSALRGEVDKNLVVHTAEDIRKHLPEFL